MAFETIEVHSARTIREFVEIILKKQRVAAATEDWCEVHFSTETPFGHGPTLTSMLEGTRDIGVDAVVLLRIRASFDEEEVYPQHAAFFRAWRRMMMDGQLVRCLDFLFNNLRGDLEGLREHLSGLRREAIDIHDQVSATVEALHMASTQESAETATQQFKAYPDRARRIAERIHWCLFYEQMREYLVDEQS